jgi:hypothetical protein
MVVRYEPYGVSLVGVHENCEEILNMVGWLDFFGKFEGHNLEITRAFAHSFDGECAQIGNLTQHISENLLFEIELTVLDNHIKNENEIMKQNTTMMIRENDSLKKEVEKKEKYATVTQGKAQEIGHPSKRYKLRTTTRIQEVKTSTQQPKKKMDKSKEED